MLKSVLAVIVGYLVMFVFISLSFSATYLLLGSDGAFQPDSFDVSQVWIALSVLLSLVAAIAGGFVAVVIDKSRKAAMYLAGLVLVLGLGMAVPSLLSEGEVNGPVRTGDVSMMESMKEAKQPVWLAVLNPFLGVAGIIVGVRLKKEPGSGT